MSTGTSSFLRKSAPCSCRRWQHHVSFCMILTIKLVVVFLASYHCLETRKIGHKTTTFDPSRGLVTNGASTSSDSNDISWNDIHPTIKETPSHYFLHAAPARLVRRDEFMIVRSKGQTTSAARRSSSATTAAKNQTPRHKSVKADTHYPSSLNLVLCTTVRNEAPYLWEWIEYHRMIGFDSIFIMNDKSTDDTQCILDAYAEEKIVVRVPQDFESTTSTIRPLEQYSTFQACQEYLTQSLSSQEFSHTWMLTSDVDEFLWFDQQAATGTSGSSSSLSAPIKQVVSNLLLRTASRQQKGSRVVQSLVIPRLLFGSSGHDHYDTDLVMNRFTHRFDARSCPASSHNKLVINNTPGAPLPKQPRRRRLFDHAHPTSYCISKTFNKKKQRHEVKTSSSFDNYKSMSLVPAMATKCHKMNRHKTNETEHAYCHNPHLHQLLPHHTSIHTENDTRTSSTLRDASTRYQHDARYLGPNQVYSTMAIMHYSSKSRAEFYERACDSRFSSKYFECQDCTPESYFKLTETYSNLLEDDRMRDFAKQLLVVLNRKDSDDLVSVDHCHTEPPTRKSWEDYHECFRKQSMEYA